MQKVTRRQFSQRVLRVLMYGGFTHFALADVAKAMDPTLPYQPPLCPGGGHNQDLWALLHSSWTQPSPVLACARPDCLGRGNVSARDTRDTMRTG